MKYQSSPAWSLSSRRDEKKRNDSPGPGAYSPKPVASSPGPKVGSGKRSDLVGKTANPGPGAYSPVIGPRTIGAVFGSSGREKSDKRGEIPGPGTYVVPSKAAEGPSWGISGRYKERSAEERPGPGAYDTVATVEKAEKEPAWSFGNSKQREVLKTPDAPGPGQYYNQNRKKESPTWVFGRGPKGEAESKSRDFPAPGNYSIPNTLDKRAFSISGRHPDPTEKRTAFVPGPGAYSPALPTDNPQFSVSRGSRWRESHRHDNVPGPGAYDQSRRVRATSAVVGTSQRQGIVAPSTAPGPGAYSVSVDKSGPQFSFAGRHDISAKSVNPGPGQYDHTTYGYVLERPASAVWGTDTKGEKTMVQTLPGPGEYDQGTKLGSGPNYSFGNEKRKWIKDDPNPGPGTYVVTAPADRRSASISGRHPIRDYKVVPGPGAYEVKTNKGKTPSFSVGRGRRSEVGSAKDVPGPGQYPVRNSLSSQGVRIGTARRDAGEQVSAVPGPGNYPVSATLGEGPSYSLRGKYYKDPQQDGPGPGSYSQDASFVLGRSPSVQFGRESKGSLEAGKSVDSTGPGMYYSPGKPTGAKWSFGSEKKGTVTKSDIPGPGTYEIKSTISEVPTYLMPK